jgi:hypothetical protein
MIYESTLPTAELGLSELGLMVLGSDGIDPSGSGVRGSVTVEAHVCYNVVLEASQLSNVVLRVDPV